MKSFLAMFMVLIVSGDDEVIINGTMEDRVLLPCLCTNRNLAEEFRWQMEQPNQTKVLVHLSNISDYGDKYRSRAKIFQNEDKYNCSLLLTNITADDQGKYRCSFREKDRKYIYSIVRLNVNANFSVCQTTTDQVNNSPREKKCTVVGRYRDAEILWYLDQQLLTNSTTTKITHTYTSTADGDHIFTSKIITELNGTSHCEVKAKGVSAVISSGICHKSGEVRGNPENSLPCYRGYFKLIPIGLVIGVSLILLYRWKHSQGLRRDRQVETNPFLS